MIKYRSNSLLNPKIDLSETEDYAKNFFVERLGGDIVLDVMADKYPSNYEVVVFVKEKKNVDEMLDLCFELSDRFKELGLNVGVSTRVKK